MARAKSLDRGTSALFLLCFCRCFSFFLWLSSSCEEKRNTPTAGYTPGAKYPGSCSSAFGRLSFCFHSSFLFLCLFFSLVLSCRVVSLCLSFLEHDSGDALDGHHAVAAAALLPAPTSFGGFSKVWYCGWCASRPRRKVCRRLFSIFPSPFCSECVCVVLCRSVCCWLVSLALSCLMKCYDLRRAPAELNLIFGLSC